MLSVCNVMNTEGTCLIVTHDCFQEYYFNVQLTLKDTLCELYKVVQISLL